MLEKKQTFARGINGPSTQKQTCQSLLFVAGQGMPEALPAVRGHIVGDDGGVASPLGHNGLGGIVAGVHVDVGQGAQQHVRPGHACVACKPGMPPGSLMFKVGCKCWISGVAGV